MNISMKLVPKDTANDYKWNKEKYVDNSNDSRVEKIAYNAFGNDGEWDQTPECLWATNARNAFWNCLK